jgi:hypothetical protein
MGRLLRTLGAPLRRFFDPRFARLEDRIDDLHRALGETEIGAERKELARAAALGSVDVSAHNAGSPPPSFRPLVSQVVSAAQFEHPSFQRFAKLLTDRPEPLPWSLSRWPPGRPERKLWEWCYILAAAEQAGALRAGSSALGFGVGTEPVPAALARAGVRVLATDMPPADAGAWALTGQHLASTDSMSRPAIVPDNELTRLVALRYVDMNDVPDDLGSFDLIWSSCAIEHLGSPEAGLRFVVRTLTNLRPGGVSVHTTELELTRRDSTADYGHLAVYRVDDLERLRDEVAAAGCEMTANWHVPLETAADRWIALPPYEVETEPYHFKLKIGDSIATSVGILISKPG